MARINEEKKRLNAPYFKASAKCNEKNCKCDYSLSSQRKPLTDNQGFVEITVRRTETHYHKRNGNASKFLLLAWSVK